MTPKGSHNTVFGEELYKNFRFPRSEFGAGSEASSGQVKFQISSFKLDFKIAVGAEGRTANAAGN
jgi:hypothetical protein